MKKAIVVGATSGIGRGMAKLLIQKGFKVGITGRRVNLLEEIKNEDPASYSYRTMDVTDYERIPDIMNDLVLELGGLDLLIISSGTGTSNPDFDFDVDKQTLDTNIYGFTKMVDWGHAYFADQGHGHLVGISSIAGIRGNRISPAYSSTKSYQKVYLDSLRHKFIKLKSKIYVTNIMPGFIDTAMANADHKFMVASVERACKHIYQAIQCKKGTAYVTREWALIAWIFKLLPNFFFYRL